MYGHPPSTRMKQAPVSDENNGLLAVLRVRDITDPNGGRDERHLALSLAFPAIHDGRRRARPTKERCATATPRHAWSRSGSAFWKFGAAEHGRPQRPIFCAEHLELLEQLACKLHIAESARGNELPITDGGSIHVVGGFRVPGHMRPQVVETVTGVTSPPQKADPGDRDRCRADGRNWNIAGIELFESLFEDGFDGPLSHRSPPGTMNTATSEGLTSEMVLVGKTMIPPIEQTGNLLSPTVSTR
jgi:hypothetical protein